MNKSILIWGAGKIGRGFLAELFQRAGYHIVFVVRSPALLQQLQQQSQYEIVRSQPDGQCSVSVVSGYSALLCTDSAAVSQAVVDAPLVAMPVYPRDFAQIAAQLAPALVARGRAKPDEFLNILLGTNAVDDIGVFRRHLMQALPAEVAPYVESRVGLVETLILCTVTDPPPEERAQNPLRMWASGYSSFPIDRNAFKGPVPEIPQLRLTDNAQADKVRKIFMNNMAHATLAYLGATKGYTLIVQAVGDPEIRAHLLGALSEAGQALQKEYGIGADELDELIRYIFVRYDNPNLADNIVRVAADPIRKLGRNDRLVGPALLAIRHGIWPTHLVQSIAAALRFNDPRDAAAQSLQNGILHQGLEETIRSVCALSADDRALTDAIVAAYRSRDVLETGAIDISAESS